MARPSKSTSQDVPLQSLRTSTRDGSSQPESTPGTPGPSHARSQPQPQESGPQSPQSPLAHFKARFARFTRHDDDDHSDSEGSEHELLLDPNLPVEHSQRHQALPHRHSLSATVDRHAADDAAGKTSLDSDDRAPLVSGSDDHDGAGEREREMGEMDEGEEEEVEDSPYPEVRAAVHPYDDPSLPCNTLRAWAIGLSLIFLGASMNTLFSLRSPNISLGALIAQVIAWYVCVLLFSVNLVFVVER